MNRVCVIAALAVVVFAWPTVAAAQLPVNVASVGGETPIDAVCDNPATLTSVPISVSASGDTELVALTTNQIVYLCGYDVIAAGTVNVTLVYGTGSNCATGKTSLTGAYPLVANSGLARANAGYPQTKGAVSNAVCITLSGAVQVSGMLTYVKQ